MPTETLERPVTESAVDEQRFRVTQINFGAEIKLKYQLADGIEWGKPKPYDISSISVNLSSCNTLKDAVRRIFEAEDWSDASLEITGLKLTYAELDDKPKAGQDERKPGELTKIAIAAAFQSQFLFTTKDLPLGTFEQVVYKKNAGQEGYLTDSEITALEDLIDEVQRELARRLNKRTVFRPQQMKLF